MILIDKILTELKSLPEYGTQIGLQGWNKHTDPFEACGKTAELKKSETEYTVPLFDIPYTNSIIKELGLYRTRLMNMKPVSCYSYHKDYSKRIHIPLITNEKCFFVINGEAVWTPADGNYYEIDTTQMHTFVNGSFQHRLHIVGNIGRQYTEEELTDDTK